MFSYIFLIVSYYFPWFTHEEIEAQRSDLSEVTELSSVSSVSKFIAFKITDDSFTSP